mgnify:CR=1 FL=1
MGENIRIMGNKYRHEYKYLCDSMQNAVLKVRTKGLLQVDEHAKENGYYTIQWDVDSLDWKDYGVDSIIDTVVNHKNLGNGSIILCHNGAKYTKDALEVMIAGLKEKGYEIVPISELIYREDYHMDVTGRQIKN